MAFRYQPAKQAFGIQRKAISWIIGALVLSSVATAHAVSCTVAASLSPADRAALFDAAHGLGEQILAGNATTLRSRSTPSLSSGFGDISSTITSLAPELTGATLNVTNLYALDARDLKGTQDEVQFFCGVAGAQLLVTVTIPSLPPGKYALALLHATEVKAPQQFALILEDTGTPAIPDWRLAGFFERPLTLAGHDSVWFWQQARQIKAKGDSWGSFFYYQAAAYLARPADLYTSPNLEKLSRETASTEPQGLPGQKPMTLTSAGQTYTVTGMRVDDGLGALDLRVDLKVASVADPVAARKSALDVMAALLQQHPGLRTSFHGIWVYETTVAGQSFAVEQPVSALP